MSNSSAAFSLPSLAWVLKPGAASAAVASSAGRPLTPLIAQLLAQRGFALEEDVHTFLNPKLAGLGDPFLLPEMDKAVKRIFE
ncbi:MAG: recj: single-stranded-dna-specific exonuclease recj, partial [Verrucomicrobiaceae bacterium]|nr:recj: single-stranded-dna-specific exonuclease recj [Verrucomicrobiaceae bacterium]